MTSDSSLPTYAVLLAGGSGTRLWPLAGPARPKPFLPLVGGRSLFRATYDRIVPLVGRKRVLVVAGKEHARWVRRVAPEIAAEHLLLEEIGRNTAASVTIAALWIRERHGDGLMIVLPSDHWIQPAAAFRGAVRRAARVARRTECLMTIGIPARFPDTGFGYIRPAGRRAGPGVRRVAAFVEKPEAARARRMVRSGGYLWNSGMFVWTAGAILRELQRHRTDVLRPLEAWAGRSGHRTWRVPREVLSKVPPVPIDRAVLESSSRALVLRAPFRWSDLGNWDALGRVLDSDRGGNGGIGRILAVDSTNCLGVNEGGTTVFVGVHDLAAIRSGPDVLICHRKAAQRVRDAARRLRALSVPGRRP